MNVVKKLFLCIVSPSISYVIDIYLVTFKKQLTFIVSFFMLRYLYNIDGRVTIWGRDFT